MEGNKPVNSLDHEKQEDWELNPLVSIIVPVYNVRMYVEECVESLLCQTYTNLEIILVDDGSTDSSGEICDEYARKDARIQVIHQENRGPSGARNVGLDNANGDYIAFVDSDDLVMPDYIEVLYGLIVKHGADISACSYVKGTAEKLQDFSGNAADGGDFKEVCMSAEKMLKQWHGKYKQQETVAWNKLYHRNVWNCRNKMRFPECRKYEDVLTSHLIIQSIEKVALTTQKLYLYRVRGGSITMQTECIGEGVRQNLSAQRERMVFFRKHRYWRAYFNLMAGYVLHLGWFGWRMVIRRFTNVF